MYCDKKQSHFIPIRKLYHSKLYGLKLSTEEKVTIPTLHMIAQ